MYAKVNDEGQLNYLTTKFLSWKGMTYYNPQKSILNEAGYYEVPAIAEGKRATKWKLDDGTLVPTLEDIVVETPVRIFSKLRLIGQLKNRDLYDKFIALVKSAGLEDEWVAANDLRDNNDTFMDAAETIRQTLDVTEDEFNEILNNSIMVD